MPIMPLLFPWLAEWVSDKSVGARRAQALQRAILQVMDGQEGALEAQLSESRLPQEYDLLLRVAGAFLSGRFAEALQLSGQAGLADVDGEVSSRWEVEIQLFRYLSAVRVGDIPLSQQLLVGLDVASH